jgi:hypothetical protein
MKLKYITLAIGTILLLAGCTSNTQRETSYRQISMTDAITMMVMVAGNKIVGMQTELAPQMNAATHIFATAMDARESDDGYKVGALAEALMKVDSMQLTIIEVGEAEFASVPEDIVKTATMKGSLDTDKLMTSAMESENLLESSEKK